MAASAGPAPTIVGRRIGNEHEPIVIVDDFAPDPAALRASPETIAHAVDQLIEAGSKARGHILNLGHGVVPTTPVEGVRAFVEAAQRIRK